jgi:phenylalanyl-tRNA synthetase beta chain
MKREVDLIEEIARLYGVDKIPATPQGSLGGGALGSHPFDSAYDDYAEVRRILSACGLTEAQGQTLISSASIRALQGEDSLGQVLPLENPLSSDMDVLRSSLLPGLLDSLRHNLHHQNGDVRLFEIGRTFTRNSGEIREERRIAVALTGRRKAAFWSGEEREAKLDIYDLKGTLEELFEQLGVRGVQWVRPELRDTSALHLDSARILIGKHPAGELGQLNPITARKYDLRDPVLIAEFNLDFLLARRGRSRSLKPLPAFPSVRRDLAMLIEESVPHEKVVAVVKQAKPQNLENVQLFDVFRGKSIPSGRKSVAYAFTYRNAERTLTEAEVNAAQEKLLQQLKTQLNAEIRA